MEKDRSHWVVRQVSFDEAEKLDDTYYVGLSQEKRLEILMELRSLIDPGIEKIERVVSRRKLYEEEI